MEEMPIEVSSLDFKIFNLLEEKIIPDFWHATEKALLPISVHVTMNQ